MFFSRKQVLTFHANDLFSRKKKRKILLICCLPTYPRVVKVKLSMGGLINLERINTDINIYSFSGHNYETIFLMIFSTITLMAIFQFFFFFQSNSHIDINFMTDAVSVAPSFNFSPNQTLT